MLGKALTWLSENLYNYMIPLCLLCVLRVVMCLLELQHMKRLRDKKFAFHKVGKHYKEIGTYVGLFIGFVAVCVLPLKLLWAVVAVVLGVLGYKIGAKKGAEADEFWRQVVEEIAASEDADKLTEAPAIERNVHGFLDNLDLYGEEEEETAEASAASAEAEEAAEVSEPVAENEET